MNVFDFKELKENEDFDPSTLCGSVPFTQAGFYGDWQKSIGRNVRRFLVQKEGTTFAYFQIIAYPLFRGKKYLYIPYGPVTKESSEEFLNELKSELQKIAKSENAVFVRLDFTPPIPNDLLSTFLCKAKPCTYHSAYFQPRTEWYLSLQKSEDEILADMHDKNRYSIRTAEKREVTVEIVTADFEHYFNAFYGLMEETAKRDGFSLHGKKYYEAVFKDLSKTNSFLSVARYQERIVAIGLIIIFGKTANYVFGASANDERNRMPTYLSQWKAILHAKNLGCEDYNFGGVTSEQDTHTSWEGLTRFKKRFGGREIQHSDFFDLVVQPLWYRLYTLRKRLQNR